MLCFTFYWRYYLIYTSYKDKLYLLEPLNNHDSLFNHSTHYSEYTRLHVLKLKRHQHSLWILGKASSMLSNRTRKWKCCTGGDKGHQSSPVLSISDNGNMSPRLRGPQTQKASQTPPFPYILYLTYYLVTGFSSRIYPISSYFLSFLSSPNHQYLSPSWKQ